MKKVKKIAILMLALLLIFGTFGCSNNNNNDTDNSSNTNINDNNNEEENNNNTSIDNNNENNSENINDNEEEPYNVVIEWLSIGSVPTEENMQKVEQAINEITIPEINTTVSLYPVELSDLENKNMLAISTGEKIDLICSVGTGVSNLVDSGIIVAMDEYLEQYGQEMEECLGDSILGGYYENKLYGVPNAYIQGESYGYVGREDLFEKYNIEVDPSKLYSLSELGDIFKTVKDGEGDGFYCLAGLTSNSDLFTEFVGTVDKLGSTTASGGLLLHENWDNTTVENIYASEQYAEFAQTMYDWQENGYIPADAASNTDQGATQIKAGNYFGQITWTTDDPPVNFITQTGYDATMIEMLEPYKTTDRYQNILWSIPTTSEKPEKAFQFLNMLYADNDIDTMLMFGLEGETYEVVKEDDKGNRVVKFVDGVDASTAPFYCYAGVYGDRLSWPIWEPASITFNEDKREFNESIENVSPALGYCFILPEELASKYSAVSSVIEEYVSIISAGVVNPEDALPEFNEALENAGINDLVEENQKQLDAWLEANK